MVNIEEITRYAEVDQTFFESAQDVKADHYVSPINEKEQKQAFMEGQRNPRFVYKEIGYNPKDTEKKLQSLIIPYGIFKPIFEKKRRHVLLENHLIDCRGKPTIVQAASRILYGVPNLELVNYAKDLLKRTEDEKPQEKTVLAHQVKGKLERALLGEGLDNWVVEFSDKYETNVLPAEGRITLCKDRVFSRREVDKLISHEIGGHCVRAANGYNQPLTIFATGFPGYLTTEEGLAIFCQEITGNDSSNSQRSRASLTLAVDSVCHELDFRDTFDRLRDHGLGENKAWRMALRAHRSGGYIKDHVYLDGIRKIGKFIEKGGDVRELYVGKVGLDDLPFVGRLIGEGLIEPAERIPSFIAA